MAKSGGNFTLTSDVDFGANFGVIAKYLKSKSSNISSSGIVRFANNEGLGWRNAANGADKVLKVNASDRLDYDGGTIPTLTSTDALTNKTIVAASNTITTAASGNLSATELNAALAELQADIDTRQPLDAELTALAGLSSDGLIARTGAGTVAARTLTAGSNKLTVSDGNGVSGNPTVDVAEANLTLDNIGGTLGIAKGGTGQTGKTAAFDALSPLTTVGDLIAFNGSDNIRFAAGSDGQVLTADSGEASGLSWTSPLVNPMDSEGDLIYGGVGGAATKLDAGTSGQVLIAQGAAAPSWNTLSGDVTINSSGVTAIGSGVIVNADINASAAIAYSKLNLATSIVDADINGSAAISGSKLQAASSSNVGTVSREQSSTNQSKTPSGAYASGINFNFGRVGKVVTISMDDTGDFTALANASVLFAAGTIPSDYRPTSNFAGICRVKDGGTTGVGSYLINTDGSMSCHATASGGNFTNAATGRVWGINVSFVVD